MTAIQEAVHHVLINHYGETLTAKLISIIETEINQEDINMIQVS